MLSISLVSAYLFCSPAIRFSDGVCRLAAAPFVASTFAGADFEFAHLTNHCIAARHPDYGRIAPGNEMFFDAFDAYLESSASASPSTPSSSSDSSEIPRRRSVAADLMPQICSVLALAFESVRDVCLRAPSHSIRLYTIRL